MTEEKDYQEGDKNNINNISHINSTTGMQMMEPKMINEIIPTSDSNQYEAEELSKRFVVV